MSLFITNPSPSSSGWVVSAHFVQKSVAEPSSVLTHLSMSVCQGVGVLIARLYLRVLFAEVFTAPLPEESFSKVLMMLK